MKIKQVIKYAFCMACVMVFAPSLSAQEQSNADNRIYIEPLFEYPVVPDELGDNLTDRADYQIENFWNNFDFKNKNAVDQNALNHAFEVYASAMPYATSEKVIKSVDKLIEKIKKNPTLSYQFAKAAEEILYGPRASMWIDEVYIKFLENLVANKKIDKSKKLKFQDQLSILKNSAVGAKAYRFNYVSRDGQHSNFMPKSDFTLIEFGNPECDDCRYAKLKMDISSVLNDLLYDNRLDIYFIITEEDEDGSLLKSTSTYPDKWIVGKAGELDDYYDLRATPSLYLIDKDGKIIAKNISVDNAIAILEVLSQQ